MLASLTASISLFAAAGPPAGAVHSEEHDFRIETVASGLKGPWGMVKLPDDRFLVTEKGGTLRLIENGKLLDAPVEGVPSVAVVGQGGLLDIELHPDYAKNGWIYLAFSKALPKGALTSIVRARLKGNRLVDIETIFDPPADEATDAGVHFGCRMEFDKQGHLFFTIGDRGDVTTPANNAQRVDNVKGKVHRIMDDGKIPEDNPFVKTSGARPSIWSYGNRNPQGLKIQPGTGLLWETEHGPRGGDELNIIHPGKNYGWPVITFGINYNGTPITDHTSQPGMEQPVKYWVPSPALCGIDFYNGKGFPKWEGNLFVTALAHAKLFRLRIEEGKVTHEEQLLAGSGRIRDVRCFDDGFLYVIYDQDKIVRLVPAE